MALRPKTALAGHTAGIFADMTLDGPEIGTLVVVVDRAKNLPNRKTMGKQDPYCAMRLGKEAKKTETDRRGGQTPKWDQELRFTVHESPDYYRLKVSCFNDDRKTDLIGDTFVDLTDLVKPGGGSNDLWHQLNYKGKYAGDIRMEMTYYDTRPRESKPPAKRRNREGNTSVAEDQDSSLSMSSGPRQLGPREIRRRPLPDSPGQTPPAAVTSALVQHQHQHHHQHQQDLETARRHDLTTMSQQTEVESAFDQQHQPVPPTQQHPALQRPAFHQQSNQGPQRPPKIPLTEPGPYYPSTVSAERPLPKVTRDEYRQPSRDSILPSEQPMSLMYGPTGAYNQDDSQFIPQQHRTSGYPPDSAPIEPYNSYPSRPELDESAGKRRSRIYSSQDSYMSRAEETYMQDANDPVYAAERPEYRRSVSHNSQSAYPGHGDSHSGYSTNLYGISSQFVEEPSGEDAPPPPPRHQPAPRRQLPDPAPLTYATQPVRPTPRRPTIEERSPLQHIERQYEPHMQAQHSVAPRSSSHERWFPPSPTENFAPNPPPNQLVKASHLPHVKNHQRQSYYEPHPIQQDASNFRRRSSYNAEVENGYQNHFGSTHTAQGAYHDQRASENVPTMANRYISGPNNNSQQSDRNNHQYSNNQQPRQSSSTVPKTFPRKAVSPEPNFTQDGRRLSSTPYGPDAYDVLNPASSPVTNENTAFETPEQARHSARMGEAANSRELGPIIGNDGKEIDPSDHLPSDTWAPEPERKQRRPEHVIHFRTKNAARGNVTPASSPASQRMSLPRDSPNSPATNTPGSAQSAGRSRLQKPMPHRPTPTQSYQKPYVESSPPNDTPTRQSHHRKSFQETSPTSHRPSLSEYQVPTGNSYTPRGSMYNNHASTPPSMPIVSGNHPETYGDPLAAEMSMIDIGPSRGTRTMVRSDWAY